MEDAPRAFLCHAVPGRIRLQVPERRGDHAYFATVDRTLAAAEDVAFVSVRPMTGSVVIHHDGDREAIASFARDQGLFDLSGDEPPVPPVAEGLRAAAAAVDRRIARWSGGGLDLATLTALVLVIVALVQLSRGRLFGPASSLLWLAASALRMSPESTDDRPES